MPVNVANAEAPFVLGIDVGGTFTDVVCVGPAGLLMRKTPSRPDAPGEDVMQGFTDVAADLGLAQPRDLLRNTALIVHGSTVATNALLTRSGARVGLITTRGFRDIVEMRGGIRESTFDRHMVNAEPLAPRPLRLEVAESVDRGGSIRQAPDAAAVLATLRSLRRRGMEALAIAFKHSSANPANERAVAQLVRESYPDLYVSSSADLSRRARLYDRTSTAVVNSHIGPATARYLDELLVRLAELEFGGQLLIMAGNGGVISSAEARSMPAMMILSGPAAGPTAALRSGRQDDRPENAIVIDMGGTSFDVSVIRDGAVAMAASRDVNRYRISVPMLDIQTVGAGGGSIAWVDEVGLLQVGPQSAGAIPGPAAYSRGGVEPTVTDANLVLGLLDPDAVLGGRQALSLAAAQAAVDRLAQRLGLPLVQAARGIREVANGSMTAAIRSVTLGRGLDPRGVPIVAGGGAGPLHAGDLAANLNIGKVLVPWHSGVLCALGMAVTDVRYESVVSLVRTVDHLPPDEVGQAIDGARKILQLRMADLADEIEDIAYTIEVEARYGGQFHELVVPMQAGELDGSRGADFVDRFHRAHSDAYGFSSESSVVEVVAIVVRASASLRHGAQAIDEQERYVLEHRDSRLVYLDDRLPSRVPVFRASTRTSGTAGSLVQPGPALIDLPTTTVWIPPGWTVTWQEASAIELVRQ